MGLFTYFESDEDVVKVLKNVHDSMNEDSYLVAKDTLNGENKEVVFLLYKKTGYTAIYRSKKNYYRLFKKAGFKLVKEMVLDEVAPERIKMISQGSIWARE